jgi:SAM-dependent methyltransferase
MISTLRRYLKGARKPLFQPNYAGWNPRAYEWYFGTALGAAIRNREEDAAFGMLGAVMQPDHLVLESGPGTGNYTVPVARRCRGMVAIDSSPEMLRYLRERLGREGLANVETRLGRLPERLETSQKFDGALAIGILNYVKDLEESLRVLASALKPGGWAVFNVPLTTAEGRIYILQELAGRRRINALSPEEVVKLTEKVGLRVWATAPAGLSRAGLTLMVGAMTPDTPIDGPC